VAEKRGPSRTAKQALGYVEEKLRRVFKLAGPIGTTLDPEVKPVIIVDDLRDPGHAFYQGRSFAVQLAHLGPIAAGTKGWGVRFTDDVIIDRMLISTAPQTLSAGMNITVYTVTPDEVVATPPYGINAGSLAGMWRDRKTLTSDQPPMFQTSGVFAAGAGGTGPTGNNTLVRYFEGQVVPSWPGGWDVQLFIPSGGGVVFEEQNILTSISVALYGRVWPQ
jgi:hypothetical protein